MARYVSLLALAGAALASEPLATLRGAVNGTGNQRLSPSEANWSAEHPDHSLAKHREGRLVANLTTSADVPTCCSYCPKFCSPASGQCHSSHAKSYYQKCNGSVPLDVMTLYHTTSPENARSIVAGGFQPGRGGWCGGASYFMDYPGLPKSKMNPKKTKTGAIVEAKVLMGKTCSSTRPDGCNDGYYGKCCPIQGGRGRKGAAKAGCNSIVFDPSDGPEYIIWEPERVLFTRIYCQGARCLALCMKRGHTATECR